MYRFDADRLETLEKQLETHQDTIRDNIGVIVADTLNSGHGGVSDLGAMYALAEKYDCLLYFDEAHAVGALGEEIALDARDGGRSSEINERTSIHD